LLGRGCLLADHNPWFWAAYLIATHHPGISAKQLQRQLGLSRYETAWLILQELRRAMVAPESANGGDSWLDSSLMMRLLGE
jgi:hypothetical protein